MHTKDTHTNTTDTFTDDDQSDSNDTAANPFRDALDDALVRPTDGDRVADPTEREDNYHVLLESLPDRPLGADEHVDQMAGPAHDCGCDGIFCPSVSDNVDISNTCDNPTVPTMAWATTQFKKLIQYGHDRHEGLNVRRAKAQYARLLYGDRRLQERYNGLTSVLLTFRLSPTTDEDRLRPPLVMHDQLSGTWSKAYQRLSGRYGILDDYEYEYVRVYSGTETFATPHLHLLLHVDDPSDELRPDDFQRAIDAHTNEYRHARQRDHVVFSDGDDGAVRLSHEPPQADDTEYERALQVIRGTDKDSHRGATTAGMYLGTQIPRLLVTPVVEGDADDVPRWKWDTATWSWASPKDTVGFSRGWPDKDE